MCVASDAEVYKAIGAVDGEILECRGNDPRVAVALKGFGDVSAMAPVECFGRQERSEACSSAARLFPTAGKVCRTLSRSRSSSQVQAGALLCGGGSPAWLQDTCWGSGCWPSGADADRLGGQVPQLVAVVSPAERQRAAGRLSRPGAPRGVQGLRERGILLPLSHVRPGRGGVVPHLPGESGPDDAPHVRQNQLRRAEPRRILARVIGSKARRGWAFGSQIACRFPSKVSGEAARRGSGRARRAARTMGGRGGFARWEEGGVWEYADSELSGASATGQASAASHPAAPSTRVGIVTAHSAVRRARSRVSRRQKTHLHSARDGGASRRPPGRCARLPRGGAPALPRAGRPAEPRALPRNESKYGRASGAAAWSCPAAGLGRAGDTAGGTACFDLQLYPPALVGP